MNEGDVVLFRPACEHVFLRNEAVVVPPTASLVLDVCDTFIGAPGLVIVIGHLLASRFFSGKRRDSI